MENIISRKIQRRVVKVVNGKPVKSACLNMKRKGNVQLIGHTLTFVAQKKAQKVVYRHLHDLAVLLVGSPLA